MNRDIRGLLAGLVVGVLTVGTILADGAVASGTLVPASGPAAETLQITGGAKAPALTMAAMAKGDFGGSGNLELAASSGPATLPLPTLRGKTHVAAILNGEYVFPSWAKPHVLDNLAVQGLAAKVEIAPDKAGPHYVRGGSRKACFHCLLQRVTKAHGVPFRLAKAVIQIESSYDRWAVGGVGEIGLMQVRPQTANWLGFEGDAADLFNPRLNLHYGVLYLARAWHKSGGDLCGTILKYNAGHNATKMNPVSQQYCDRVQALLGDGAAQVVLASN